MASADGSRPNSSRAPSKVRGGGGEDGAGDGFLGGDGGEVGPAGGGRAVVGGRAGAGGGCLCSTLIDSTRRGGSCSRSSPSPAVSRDLDRFRRLTRLNMKAKMATGIATLRMPPTSKEPPMPLSRMKANTMPKRNHPAKRNPTILRQPLETSSALTVRGPSSRRAMSLFNHRVG